MTSEEAPLGEHRRTHLLEQYRRRFPGLEDAEWERLVQRLQGEEGIRAIGRELVERGLCGRLRPSSVNVYLSWVKRLLQGQGSGAPRRGEGDGGREGEQPITAQDVLKLLRWLIRVQQRRLRKALALERRMGGLLLPQTDKAIKLLCVLTDKELKLLKALGGLQATAPRRRRMEEAARDEAARVVLGVDPAGALRVVTAVQRTLRLVRESESSAESPPPTDGPSAPDSRGEGSHG